MAKKQGKLIIFSGPSGVGKKTIWSNIIDQNKYNIIFSISMTTRKKRVNEKNKVDYFFVSKKEFKNAIKTNQLLEWASYVSNYYGTPRNFVEQNLNKGKNVFLEIEVQGALSVIKNWKNTQQLLTIFVAPPSIKILKERLINRKTETLEIINKRIKQSKWEISQKNKFKHIIINDKILLAKKQLIKILNNELGK